MCNQGMMSDDCADRPQVLLYLLQALGDIEPGLTDVGVEFQRGDDLQYADSETLLSELTLIRCFNGLAQVMRVTDLGSRVTTSPLLASRHELLLDELGRRGANFEKWPLAIPNRPRRTRSQTRPKDAEQKEVDLTRVSDNLNIARVRL